MTCPRKDVGSGKQNYEVREREISRHRNRPDNPRTSGSNLPIRRKSPSDRGRDPEESSTSEDTSQDEPSQRDQIRALISIPAENFVQCRTYLSKHPNLISDDAEDIIYKLASDAYESPERFRRCLQRYILIKECVRRDYKDQEGFLSRLSHGDEPTVQYFYAAYDKAEKQFHQTALSRQALGRDASERSELAAKGPAMATMGGVSSSSYRRPSREEHAGQDARQEILSSSPTYNKSYHPSLQTKDPYRSSKDPVQEGEARVITSRAAQGRDPGHDSPALTTYAPHRRTSITASHYNVHNQEIAMYHSETTRPPLQHPKIYSSSKLPQGLPPRMSAVDMNMQPTQQKRRPDDTFDTVEVTDPRPTITRLPSQKVSNVSKDYIQTLESVATSDIDYKSALQPRGLDPEFKVYHSKNFVIGWVFLIPWVEPRGESSKPAKKRLDRRYSTGPRGESGFSHPVRMVVVQGKKPGAYSHCIRINSYGRVGLKPSLPLAEKEAHAVIYPSTMDPPVGEPELTKEPIAVDMEDGHTLEPESRIHFGKIHTVEHNVKVKPVGRIAAKSMPYFTRYFNRENFPLGSNNPAS